MNSAYNPERYGDWSTARLALWPRPVTSKGKVKEKAGQVTNNPGLKAKGKAEHNVGKVEMKVGHIEKVLGM